MDIINITVPDLMQSNMNSSVQIGDIAWFSPVTTFGGFSTSISVTKIGPIRSITPDVENGAGSIVSVFIEDENAATPDLNDFLFFTKSRAVNCVSPMGYFGSAMFENNSRSPAELYSVACDTGESSK